MAKFFPVVKIVSGLGTLQRAAQKQNLAAANRERFLEKKESLAQKIQDYTQDIVDKYNDPRGLRGSNKMEKKLMGMVDQFESMEAEEQKFIGKQTQASRNNLKRVGTIMGSAVILQTANTLTSNVGVFTQDQAAQNTADNVMNAVNRGTSVLQYTLLGASAGPVGAAIGFAVGVSFQAMELATNAYKIGIKQQERNVQQTRDTDRLGYIATSRGR
jgi:hypothetical protein